MKYYQVLPGTSGSGASCLHGALFLKPSPNRAGRGAVALLMTPLLRDQPTWDNNKNTKPHQRQRLCLPFCELETEIRSKLERSISMSKPMTRPWTWIRSRAYVSHPAQLFPDATGCRQSIE